MNREPRPLYWSIRREIWENKSLYVAPLAVWCLMMFVSLVSTIGLAHRRTEILGLPADQQHARISKPFDQIAMMILFTIFIVSVFYCLDALYGERRDRSILFWKSLPVSDRTAILAKLAIPSVVLPAFAFVLIIVGQLILLVEENAVLLAHRMAMTTIAQWSFFDETLVLAWGIVALIAWHLPIYGWMLLISAWAKRATFLWAFLPFAVPAAFERGAFGTSYVGRWIKYRVVGHVETAYALKPKGLIDSASQITIGRFLATPGLWTGLIFAAICLGTTIWLRRFREPI